MDTLDYTSFGQVHNYLQPVPSGMVTKRVAKALTTGQRTLLSMLPNEGDTILLDDAVAIVSMTDERAYAQIVVLLNRGAVAVEFLSSPTVDPEIILRRL